MSAPKKKKRLTNKILGQDSVVSKGRACKKPQTQKRDEVDFGYAKKKKKTSKRIVKTSSAANVRTAPVVYAHVPRNQKARDIMYNCC